jgi:phosphopantothenoylcysteine decarboxylase/phosphopantothenate--cysteine ligase
MSSGAGGIVTPDALTYACGRPVITRISGMVEHVTFCGDGGSADLLVIAPCTANTISKISCAIDDTPVTTFATTAIGSGMPVVVVPAMHHSMFRHPGLTDNIERLEAWGIRILSPRIEEGKAKIADIDEIILESERAVMGKPLAGKKVLITSGPCKEPVDDVRILTTRSSGMMGKELALQAFRLGADVTIIHGDTIPCVTNINAVSSGEMRDAVMNELAIRGGTDIYISAAAISDFAPQKTPGKIRSGKPATISLTPLPKLLDEVMQEYSPFTVAFKIEQKPEAPAQAMLKKGIPVVLMNHPDTMGNSNGTYELLTTHGSKNLSGSKEAIAKEVWNALLGMIQ